MNLYINKIKHCPKMTKNICEGPLNICQSALKQMSNNKSPGSDG